MVSQKQTKKITTQQEKQNLRQRRAFCLDQVHGMALKSIVVGLLELASNTDSGIAVCGSDVDASPLLLPPPPAAWNCWSWKYCRRCLRFLKKSWSACGKIRDASGAIGAAFGAIG